MLKKILNSLLPQESSSNARLSEAFNSFYRELLESSLHQQINEELCGISFPSYNLLSLRDVTLLKEWLQTTKGHVFDFGCGTGMAASLIDGLNINPSRFTGRDFSRVAISYASSKFQYYQWECSSEWCLPTNHLLCIDSLYHQKLDTQFLHSLLEKVTTSALIIVNTQEGLREIEGWRSNLIDTTDEFEQRLVKLSSFLESADVKKERSRLPILWDTILKEKNKHLKLQEAGRKRIIGIYERNI